MPDEPEAHGLLAMMLLHDSRRGGAVPSTASSCCSPTRIRALWDAAQIAAGPRRCSSARWRSAGAAPTCCRPRSPRCTPSSHTTGPQIAALYGELVAPHRLAVVELNRAIAIAEAPGPERGLEIIDSLPLDDFHYLHAARAELLRRLGRIDEAREAYERALALVHDDAERRLLERRRAGLT